MQGGSYGWIPQAHVKLGDYLAVKQTVPPVQTNNLFKLAYSYLGVPYLFGGNSYNGIDCSGFVKNVFVAAGLWRPGAPRTAHTQSTVGQLVSVYQLQPGDSIYFDTKRLGFGVADHTGIYIGGGQVIHATPPRVCISNLFAGRLWRIYMRAQRG
jgi:cell wall-associated NlpC family hydrolase